MIRNMLWRAVARIVTMPAVSDWLIERARRTPYTQITGPDGTLYMDRFWLFNPYQPNNDGAGRRWAEWMPSVRIHHIVRPDSDRALHDHPWNARTFVLRGWYTEERPVSADSEGHVIFDEDGARDLFMRSRGYTGRLLFGQYHRIRNVSPGGVWTLFVTWKKQGTWGFLVDGKKVPWREYLGLQ